MTDAFFRALTDEISSLEAELQEDPRYVKLASLRHLHAIYSSSSSVTVAQHPQKPKARATGVRGMSDERAKLKEALIELLRGRTEPTPTSKVYQEITDAGFVIGGASPANNLSAMLSNLPEFQSNGRAGWTLKHDAEPENANPAGDAL